MTTDDPETEEYRVARVRVAVDDFVACPTRENGDAVMERLALYQRAWIKARLFRDGEGV